MDSRFKDWKMPVFDDKGYTEYGWRCQYHDKLILREGTDIGCFTYINARFGVEIGHNTQIGSHCAIYSEDTERGIAGGVIIGHNVMIGSHCVILPGVVIRSFSKIPAGSVIK